jgi:hypothetical protein
MRSGELEQELARMSAIAEELGPRSVVFTNQSLVATNERQSSETARKVVEALVESSVKILFVTPQYSLACTFHAKGGSAALFVRAQLDADGWKTFTREDPELLPTGFDEDLYRCIGGWTGTSLASAGGDSLASIGYTAGTSGSLDGREDT